MAVKRRDPVFVVVVSFITAYIYGLYWFYKTRGELNSLGKGNTSPLLWSIGLFVPFVNLYVLWKYCEDLEAASNKGRDKVIMFIAWLVFMPIAQWLIQEELNKLAK